MSHHGGHGYPRTKQIREEKRKRAEQDNKEYNDKYPTTQAKLDALPPTGASKQRARLTALLQKEQQKAAQPQAPAPAVQDAGKPNNQNKKNKKEGK